MWLRQRGGWTYKVLEGLTLHLVPIGFFTVRYSGVFYVHVCKAVQTHTRCEWWNMTALQDFWGNISIQIQHGHENDKLFMSICVLHIHHVCSITGSGTHVDNTPLTCSSPLLFQKSHCISLAIQRWSYCEEVNVQFCCEIWWIHSMLSVQCEVHI